MSTLTSVIENSSRTVRLWNCANAMTSMRLHQQYAFRSSCIFIIVLRSLWADLRERPCASCSSFPCFFFVVVVAVFSGCYRCGCYHMCIYCNSRRLHTAVHLTAPLLRCTSLLNDARLQRPHLRGISVTWPLIQRSPMYHSDRLNLTAPDYYWISLVKNEWKARKGRSFIYIYIYATTKNIWAVQESSTN